METYFNNLTTEDGSQKQLVQDIRRLIEEAESLIQTTGGDLSEKSKTELLARLEHLKKVCRRIDEQTVPGIQVVDRLVRRYPYQSLGAVLVGGMLLGTILNRR